MAFHGKPGRSAGGDPHALSAAAQSSLARAGGHGGGKSAAGRGSRADLAGAAATCAAAGLGRALNPRLLGAAAVLRPDPAASSCCSRHPGPGGPPSSEALAARSPSAPYFLISPLSRCCSESQRGRLPSNSAQGSLPPRLRRYRSLCSAGAPRGQGGTESDPDAEVVRPVQPRRGAWGPCRGTVPARPAVLPGQTLTRANREARSCRGRASIGGKERRSWDLKLE